MHGTRLKQTDVTELRNQPQHLRTATYNSFRLTGGFSDFLETDSKNGFTATDIQGIALLISLFGSAQKSSFPVT